MDQDLVDLCTNFVDTYPMNVDDFDGQEFFETVDEGDLLKFFRKMYELFTP